MTIINKTGYRIFATLEQVGILYSEILEVNEIMHRNTGAVHFTVGIKIVDKDFEEPYTAENVINTMGKVFGSVGLVDQEVLNELPEAKRELRSAGWYAGKHHLLVVYGGIHNDLVIYSCVNQAYYPKQDIDWVLNTNICAKFDISQYKEGGKYHLEL